MLQKQPELFGVPRCVLRLAVTLRQLGAHNRVDHDHAVEHGVSHCAPQHGPGELHRTHRDGLAALAARLLDFLGTPSTGGWATTPVPSAADRRLEIEIDLRPVRRHRRGLQLHRVGLKPVIEDLAHRKVLSRDIGACVHRVPRGVPHRFRGFSGAVAPYPLRLGLAGRGVLFAYDVSSRSPRV